MFVSAIVYIVIIVDQLTKWWAVNKLKISGDIELIKDALYFSYAENEGMAFGLLKDQRWIFLSATLLIIVVITAFLLHTKNKKKHPLLALSLGLILGGGISNMIDRTFFGTELFAGKVVDFIDFRLINFAVFNIADSAVCVGEALLIAYVLFFDSKVKGDMFSFSADERKAKLSNNNDSDTEAAELSESVSAPEKAETKNAGDLPEKNDD